MKDSGKVGVGGVIRDEMGIWKRGFCTNLGIISNVTAELWGIIRGLELAWEEGIRKIEVEIDSLTSIMLIKEENREGPYANLVKMILEWVKRDWECKIIHTWREGNRVADCLPKRNMEQDMGLTIVQEPPDSMRSLLLENIIGVAIPKFVKS